MVGSVLRRVAVVGGVAMVALGTVAGVSLAAGTPSSDSAGNPTASSSVAPADSGAPVERGAELQRSALRFRVRAIVHGEATIQTKRQGLVTVRVDRGTIRSLTADHLTLDEAGNRTETITLEQATRVRRDGKRVTAGELHVGDDVRVISRVDRGASIAVRVVVLPARA